MQLDAPAAAWMVPAAQGAHVDDAAAPVLEEAVPAAHGSHAAAAVAAWYWPLTQAGQAPRPTVAAKVPGSQSSHSDDPAAEYFPAAHLAQLDDTVAPVAVPSWPAAQPTHEAAPVPPW